jgi:hypothetical protein
VSCIHFDHLAAQIMPVLVLGHWLSTQWHETSLPAPRYVAVALVLLTLRLITSLRAVAPVPAAQARDLHGKLILVIVRLLRP